MGFFVTNLNLLQIILGKFFASLLWKGSKIEISKSRLRPHLSWSSPEECFDAHLLKLAVIGGHRVDNNRVLLLFCYYGVYQEWGAAIRYILEGYSKGIVLWLYRVLLLLGLKLIHIFEIAVELALFVTWILGKCSAELVDHGVKLSFTVFKTAALLKLVKTHLIFTNNYLIINFGSIWFNHLFPKNGTN